MAYVTVLVWHITFTLTAGSKTQAPATVPSKGVDVEAVGSINGVPTYDFDLDSLDEKPWRKPGNKSI